MLVNPALAANVGATARALKTTGIDHLALVNPAPWDTIEARRIAHGSGDILDRCKVYPDLPSAIASSSFVVGTTHRTGRGRDLDLSADELIRRIARVAQTQKVSIVFGREKDGLRSDELQFCHELLHFPIAVDHPSLNLSHAVLLATYQIYAASREPIQDAVARPTLPSAEQEHLCRHLLAALDAIGFDHFNNDPDHFLRVVRRVVGRTGLTSRDALVAHKVCSQIEKFSALHHQKPD